MTRVLGVDLGLKRTGLAISDELGLTARALPNLTPRSRAEDAVMRVEGALIVSRGMDDVTLFGRALRQLPAELLAPPRRHA